MSGSCETSEGMTNTPDQGEEFKGTESVNGILNQINGRTELMRLHTAHRYFKGDIPEVGAVLGLLSKKIDIGTDFDKFRVKPKVYVERKFDNTKDVVYVVTDMEDLMRNI